MNGITSSLLLDHSNPVLSMEKHGKLWFEPKKAHVCASQPIRNLKNDVNKQDLPSMDSIMDSLHSCYASKDASLLNITLMTMQTYGLETHPKLGNYLASILVGCGNMVDAEILFHRCMYRNEFSWNSIIQGYIDNGHLEDAFVLYWRMLEDYVIPNRYTFQSLLKACLKMRSLQRGQIIHREIVKWGFDIDPSVGSTLIDMYAKFDALIEAQEVFDNLVCRDVVSWTTLITQYAEHNMGEKALKCLDCMQCEGVIPNAITYMSALKASGNTQSIERTHDIHTDMTKVGLENDSFIVSALVETYCKCGFPQQAQYVFNHLLDKDIVSWTALLSGYVDHGYENEALSCLERMRSDNVFPNMVTYICSLKACGNLGHIDKAWELHAEIIKEGNLKDPSLGIALVDMYSKCGLLSESYDVFNELLVQSVVSWTALIAGYAEHGDGEEGLLCLNKMQMEGIPPDVVTYVCGLKACSKIGFIEKGFELHSSIIERGFEEDLSIANILVDMYAKCGSLIEAEAMIDKLSLKTNVSWTALITGYAEYGDDHRALNCIEKMQKDDISLDTVAFISVLRACSHIQALERGQKLHSDIVKAGFEKDIYVGGALVDMYSCCGSFREAEEVLNEQQDKNVVLWNALMMGYAEHGLDEKALHCLVCMQENGMTPDVVSLVCGLKVSSRMGTIMIGKKLHSMIVRIGFENDTHIANTLVDMYAKCGSLEEARAMFTRLQVRDVISWTGLILGYACQGENEQAFQMFQTMKNDGLHPDKVTVLALLAACSHSGLVEEGHKIFEVISREYVTLPTLEHHNCMVDLFGRAGQLQKAIQVLEEMPFQPDYMTWTLMLSSCHKWGYLELARYAFECAITLDEKDVSGFILMSNVYVDA